jgi:hypothetical protein
VYSLSLAKFLENEVPITADSSNFKLTTTEISTASEGHGFSRTAKAAAARPKAGA